MIKTYHFLPFLQSYDHYDQLYNPHKLISCNYCKNASLTLLDENCRN